MINFADDYEKELYEKITNGIKLNKEDLCELREFEYDLIKGGDRRWTRSMRTVCELGDKFFMLEWEQGLTENQEDSFDNQPYEVELENYVELVNRKRWNKVIK